MALSADSTRARLAAVSAFSAAVVTVSHCLLLVMPTVHYNVLVRRTDMKEYPDGAGVPFDEAEELVRSFGTVYSWPSACRRDDPMLLTSIHYVRDHCQACGSTTHLEVHHIIGGTKGRSDELTNLIMLCRHCHQSAHGAYGGQLTLAQVLWHQWCNNRETLSWLRLMLLRRQFLPRPSPDYVRSSLRSMRYPPIQQGGS